MKKIILTILVTILVLAIAAGATFAMLDHEIEIFGFKITPPFDAKTAQQEGIIIEDNDSNIVTKEAISKKVNVEEKEESSATEEIAAVEGNATTMTELSDKDDDEVSIFDIFPDIDTGDCEDEEDNIVGLYTSKKGEVFLLTQRQADSGKYPSKEGATIESKLHVKGELFASYEAAFSETFDVTWVTIDDVDILDEELYNFESYWEAFEATEIYDEEYNATHRRYDHQFKGTKVAVFTLRVGDNAPQKLALFYQEEFGYCFDVVGTHAPVVTPAPTEKPTPTPTNTPNPTLRPRETETPIPSNTPNPTLRPRETETPIPSNTPNPTLRPRKTETPISTNTPAPTLQPRETESPVSSNTPAPKVRDRQDENTGMSQTIGATLTVNEVQETIENGTVEVQKQVEVIDVTSTAEEKTQEPEPNPFVRER